MYFKDFLNWVKVKIRINNEENRVGDNKSEVIRKGEVRWTTLGVNIGREMDGKGDNFARPALVLHTIGDSLALIAPITSKKKKIPGYIDFNWLDKSDCICINQIRIISTKRLLKRIVKVSDKKLKAVKDFVREFYAF
jgi:mRNA interferase MazF